MMMVMMMMKVRMELVVMMDKTEENGYHALSLTYQAWYSEIIDF